MQEYIDMGHMDLISEEQIILPAFYLPHHAVIKESSLTTKTRVVFDASAKSSSGLSLNDVLMCGPTVQDDLFSILTRFRKHQFVLSADIEKMYRQVALDEADCCLQLILWRFSPDHPLNTYRLRTVTYGEKPASFLSTQCINILADETELHNPRLATVLRRDFYVDDLMTGADTVEECEQLQIELTKILGTAKMPLRKWYSNSPELLKNISSQSPDPLFVLEVGDQEIIKSLGLLWNPTQDSFHFFVRSLPRSSVLTKRSLLSDISRVFDPLGFLSPVLIRGKIFIQQLWQVKLTWDEPLPVDLQKRWLSFYEDLKILKSLTIPRRSIASFSIKLEIHGFCDASQDAYGACLYIRSQQHNGVWESYLLRSKSRVASLTPTTIPRLELCGAVLLIELAKKVAACLDLDIKSFHFWTDSMVVLSWIHGNPTQWKTYVANRVVQILEFSDPKQWTHVISEENPADLVSRGICATSIISSSFWWHGPNWLVNNFSFCGSPFVKPPEELL